MECWCLNKDQVTEMDSCCKESSSGRSLESAEHTAAKERNPTVDSRTEFQEFAECRNCRRNCRLLAYLQLG